MTTVYFFTWLCLALTLYVYIGYLGVLLVLGLLVRRPVQQTDIEPPVSLVIAAYNEEQVIEEKLKNSLELDYPSSKLEIIVVSDGSTDRTAEIAAAFTDSGVVVLSDSERRGKSSAINRAIENAQGEIVVFSDANAFYQPDAIRKLIRNFADPAVGVVSGRKTVFDPVQQTIVSEGTYWKYESFLKRLESRIHSTTGVVGEMLAVRRDRYTPIPSDVATDDAYLALQAMRAGMRVIYEPAAISYENPSFSAQDEVLRRERINAGRYKLFFHPRAYWPLSRPLPLFMLISHKFTRLLLPFFMLGALGFNLIAVVLPEPPLVLVITLAAQAVFYGMALLGALGWHNKMTNIAGYIVISNIAAVSGLWGYLRGRQTPLWQKARRS